MNHIPSLDGLRAISILLVIVAHVNQLPSGPKYLKLVSFGSLGVRVFFVISGFLITTLLLKEFRKEGRIDLPKFYYRRTLRIFPPFYVFLAILAVLYALPCLAHPPGENTYRGLLVAALYFSNYVTTNSWYAGHTWSLAVEEQFYLLWPSVLSRLGIRRAMLVAMIVVVGSPFLRFGVRLAHYLLEGSYNTYVSHAMMGRTFDTAVDALAIGCLLAGFRDCLHRNSLYPKILASPLMVLVPVLIMVYGMGIYEARWWNILYFTVGYTMINVGIALCLDWSLTYPAGLVGKALNSRPLTTIGVLSYSIYLWQQLFINPYTTHPWLQYPWNLGWVAAASTASYLLIEKPALHFRQRHEGRFFPPRMASQPAASGTLGPVVESPAD